MQTKFKKGQVVRIIGKDVPPDCSRRTGKIKEIQPRQPASPLRYIIRINSSDRWFHQDELEKIKEKP